MAYFDVGAQRRSLTYSVKQMLAREIELEKMRQYESNLGPINATAKPAKPVADPPAEAMKPPPKAKPVSESYKVSYISILSLAVSIRLTNDPLFSGQSPHYDSRPGHNSIVINDGELSKLPSSESFLFVSFIRHSYANCFRPSASSYFRRRQYVRK